MAKNCFDQIGNKRLSKAFNDLVAGGMSEVEAGFKVVSDENKALFDELNELKALAGVELDVKPTPKTVQPGKRLFNESNPETKTIANQYKKDNNITTPEGIPVTSIDITFAKKVADAFEQMKDDSNDPGVRAAYEAMVDETLAQYQAIADKGYKLEIFKGKGEPYANSNEMIADVKNNKHLYIFSTEEGFGKAGITDQQREENPLLRDSGVKDVNGISLTNNDIFRFVHDFFGHTERGNSFGAIGEENAWDVHARMYSPLARRAMTSETRGQNSWVNFGPQMRNTDGSIKKQEDEGYLGVKERPYAEQKSGLLPEEFSAIYGENIDKGPAEGTTKVEINEQALNDLAEKNKKTAGAPSDFNESLPKDQEDSKHAWDERQRRNFVLHSVIRNLAQRFNIRFNVINDPNQHWAGKYVGGQITLNEAYLNPDTAFHELFHPMIDALKSSNPELYNALVNELQNSEEGKEELARVESEYQELSKERQIDEALVSLLGRKSAAEKLNSGVFKQFIDWLKGLLQSMGISTTGFRSNMSISEFSKLIVNPLFSYDLQRVIDKANLEESYQKVNLDAKITFDSLITDTIRKLRADAVVPGTTAEEKRRKAFSKLNADLLDKNRNDIEALDKYILSALSNLKGINERFAQFKEYYNNKANLTADDNKKLALLLREIDDSVNLYNTAAPLLESAIELFPEQESAFDNMRGNWAREKTLMQEYKLYGSKLVAEWLFPYTKKALNKARASNNIFSVIDKDVYNSVKEALNSQGITNQDIIDQAAMKEQLRKMIFEAKQDATPVTTWPGATVSSRDPIAAALGLALGDEAIKAVKTGYHLNEKFNKLLKQARGFILFTTNQQEKDFYSKYLHQVDSWEYEGLDDKLKEKHSYKKRWAFHEEYHWDKFYNAKRIFLEQLGSRPSKSDPAALATWNAKRDAWFKANTVSTVVNGKPQVVPSAVYSNAQFASLMQDAFYREMYTAYKEANNKLGEQALRYGIVPQAKASGIKISKDSLKPKKVAETLREGIGEQEQVYFAQKINGEERKTVPIGYTRLLDDNELSFNLANSVAKFASAAYRYETMKNIEPHVQVLSNFINGNSALSIQARKAFKKSSGGLKSLAKGEKNAMPVEATRLNKQLNGFIDDLVYGHALTTEVIKLWDAKFSVYDKTDTSNNGQPTVHNIHGFENLVEFTGLHDLDYHGFEYGKDRVLGNNVVRMTQKDWNFSVKKTANNLGLLTALTNMAFNPIAAVINIVRAKIETYVEGTGGKYFNLKDNVFAEAEYFKALGSGDFFEDLRGGKPSFLSEQIIHYEAIQGELVDENGKKVHPAVANKLFRRKYLFLMQNGGEHYVQTHMLIAMMQHQKVQAAGKTISLYEAKKQIFKGQLNANDVKWNEEQDRQFKESLHFVNQHLNGNYNKLDKALLQRKWWGSLLMMFRKHLYNGFANRYRRGYVNYQVGNYTEGYYRTFFRGLTRELKDWITERKVSQFTFTPDEKYATRKMAADVAILALMLFIFKMFDDDDDDNEFSDSVALVARRLFSEGIQYTPVIGTMDLARVVKNPAASANTVESYYQAITQLITDPTERYEQSGPGYTEGDLKWKTKWSRLIPAYRQFINTQEPERLLEYYGKNSFGIFKPSAKKDGGAE